MAKTKVFIKDPNATKDFHIDWEDWLDGDTISASDWTVPSGITKSSDTNTTTTTTIWLTSGTLGNRYPLVNRITTAAGRVEDRTIVIEVQNQ